MPKNTRIVIDLRILSLDLGVFDNHNMEKAGSKFHKDLARISAKI
jgi:hypothetical protein